MNPTTPRITTVAQPFLFVAAITAFCAGGRLGTCFDVTLLRENDLYRMWFSWRPKDSVALVESRDGIHWSEPQIGLARSRDGVTGWQRHPANPILFPVAGTWDADAWDADACYKPFAIFDSEGDRWLLWYNGRKGGVEQIGRAMHISHNLGFPRP